MDATQRQRDCNLQRVVECLADLMVKVLDAPD
jgi:hypothetical protein